MLQVNSFHDQGVRTEGLAPSLSVFAYADDGRVVEGLFHEREPIIGIQWHPERPGAPAKLDRHLIVPLFKDRNNPLKVE